MFYWNLRLWKTFISANYTVLQNVEKQNYFVQATFNIGLEYLTKCRFRYLQMVFYANLYFLVSTLIKVDTIENNQFIWRVDMRERKRERKRTWKTEKEETEKKKSKRWSSGREGDERKKEKENEQKEGGKCNAIWYSKCI